jgi:hypothetical protein
MDLRMNLQNECGRADCTPARPANLSTDQMISVAATRYIARNGLSYKPRVASVHTGADAHAQYIPHQP